MQDRITTFVAENSNITKDRYNQLVLNTGELVMDIGTILEGEEAVEEGLIDEVGTVSGVLPEYIYIVMLMICMKSEIMPTHTAFQRTNNKVDS